MGHSSSKKKLQKQQGEIRALQAENQRLQERMDQHELILTAHGEKLAQHDEYIAEQHIMDKHLVAILERLEAKQVESPVVPGKDSPHSKTETDTINKEKATRYYSDEK